MKEANGKLLFKASLSDAFAKPYYHTYAPQTKAGVSKNVYKTTLNLKDVGTSSKINGKCKFVKDDKEFEYKFGIRSIEMLVDENGSPVNRKEVIGLKVNPEYDAGINPTKDVNDRTIAGIISESVVYVSEPKVFRKYSDIVKSGKYN